MSTKHSSAHEAVAADEDKVRERAYHLWEKAGRPEGSHDHHWDEAHRQVNAEKAGKAAKKAEPKAEAAAVKPAAKAAPAKAEVSKTEAPKADAAKKKTTKSV